MEDTQTHARSNLNNNANCSAVVYLILLLPQKRELKNFFRGKIVFGKQVLSHITQPTEINVKY